MKIMNKFRENEKFSTFFNIWDNKRLKGLISLGIWFVFFLIVILVFRTNTPTQVEKKLELSEIVSNINNYELVYNITQDDQINTFSGLYNNNKFIIYKDNLKYFIQDKTYLVNDDILKEVENPFDLDITKINVNNVYNIIKDEKTLYDYTTSKIKTSVYKINLGEISQLINDKIDTIDTTEIQFNTQDNELKSIKIDLTSYMNYNELKYKKYIVELVLTSINNVNDFNFNIEGVE